MNYLQKKKMAMMNSVASGGRLPSEYQEVEWIESSGSQRLEMNDYAFDGLKVVADILVPTTQSGTWFLLEVNTSTNCWVGFRNQQIRIDNGVLSTDIYERHTYSITYGTTTYPTRNYLEDDLGNSTYNGWTHYFDMNVRFLRSCKARVFGIKFYDTYNNNELTKDLVPCYRKADDVIGMYDIVNDTFYTNAGRGTFTKGNDVN